MPGPTPLTKHDAAKHCKSAAMPFLTDDVIDKAQFKTIVKTAVHKLTGTSPGDAAQAALELVEELVVEAANAAADAGDTAEEELPAAPLLLQLDIQDSERLLLSKGLLSEEMIGGDLEVDKRRNEETNAYLIEETKKLPHNRSLVQDGVEEEDGGAAWQLGGPDGASLALDPDCDLTPGVHGDGGGGGGASTADDTADCTDSFYVKPFPPSFWKDRAEAPTLREISLTFVKLNLHLLGEVGFLPDDIVPRLLEGPCKDDEVERLEGLNPAWVEYNLTDAWWKTAYQRDFNRSRKSATAVVATGSLTSAAAQKKRKKLQEEEEEEEEEKRGSPKPKPSSKSPGRKSTAAPPAKQPVSTVIDLTTAEEQLPPPSPPQPAEEDEGKWRSKYKAKVAERERHMEDFAKSLSGRPKQKMVQQIAIMPMDRRWMSKTGKMLQVRTVGLRGGRGSSKGKMASMTSMMKKTVQATKGPLWQFERSKR